MTPHDAGDPSPLANRIIPRFRYQRMPTMLMPEPEIPERVVPPQSGIHEVFDVRVGIDREIECDAFRLRWQVYCRELGYEPEERFPDGRERDALDARSVQVVVYHRRSGRPAACFRLVMADPTDPREPFHLEEVCHGLATDAVPAAVESRPGCAELSRFCILGAFRRYDGLTEAPPWGIDAGTWAAESVHRRGLAGLMWLAAADLVVALRLDYLFALMEPRLQLLGRVLGFQFRALGPAVEFRGQRVPYRIDRRSLRSLLLVPQTRALMEPLAARLEADAWSHPLLIPYLRARTARTLRPQADGCTTRR